MLAACHALLGVVAARVSIASTVHAWGCLFYGLYCVAAGKPNLHLAKYAAYVTGAEVLWRMTSAYAFWEMGKYAVIAVLGLALLRSRPIRPTPLSTWFIALLLPSGFLTLSELGLNLARKQLSFNLSGPLSIAVCAAFFSRCRFTTDQLASIVRVLVLPLISMWTVVVLGIASAESLTFNTESNNAMSGGFGPNQVSMLFGLGAMATLLAALLLEPAKTGKGRLVLFAMSMAFATQAALTFSRSGLYLAVISTAAAMAVSVKNARSRNACIVGGVSIYLLGAYVIYPRLDEFTGGALTARFSEASGTGRELLIQSDLDLWMEHPLFGVGPGLAVVHRGAYFHAIAAHCELSRMIAEHGLLGFAALVLLAVEIVRRWASIRDQRFRGFMIACATFGVLVMFSNAMRVVTPGFVIGLIFCSEYVAPRRPDYRQSALR